MNWLRSILSSLSLRPPVRVLAMVPAARSWTAHDRDSLRGFLASDLGQKLVERLRATESSLAIANAADVMHTAHSAGLTTGYSQALKHLVSLSCSADAQAENQNSGAPGEAQPIEQWEAEMLARMSP